MSSYIFYAFYTALCLSSGYFVVKNKVFLLYPLIFTSQFNVTSFLKVGVTISFFEINLLIVTTGVLIYHSLIKTSLLEKIKILKQDYVWLFFLTFSFISILIACIRVFFNNLNPNPDIVPAYYLRSFMSLNKFFLYLPCFYLIRCHLFLFYPQKKIKQVFLLAAGLSGILPVIAVILQFSHIGFILIHNNPSFAESYRIENYLSARPAGLTNEASFFVYQLFFSLLALYYSWKENLLSNINYILISFIYITGVVLSISRTGLLIFALFYFLIWLRGYNIFSIKGFLKILKFVPLIILFVLLVASLDIGGFNIGDRFLSTFQQEADISTLERYGSAQALFNLFINKTIIFGVGIYNFQYYILNYLPSYMDVFYYPKGATPSSFNFVFQIFVEFGLILSSFFFFLARKNIFNSNNDRFYKDWFLFLLIFSLSFQTLNFAIPFIIFLYPSIKHEKTTLYH